MAVTAASGAGSIARKGVDDVSGRCFLFRESDIFFYSVFYGFPFSLAHRPVE